MTVSAVIFDIGGVLELVKPMQFAQRWELRLELPDGEISRRMDDVWAMGAVGTVSEAELHRLTGERLNLDPASVTAMMDEMWEEYLGTGNAELIAYVASLRQRVRTGILSNSFVGATEREQQRYGISELVDVIVYSHEIGIEKPDPRAYTLVCDRLGVQPEEAIFVDDTRMCVDAAEKLGMHAILFRDNAETIEAIEATLAPASVQ
jgi:epoxide hydrolase-like predicted phosphatase